jgi:DNA (cytosine-5)-methyltransferase 1
MARELKFIDLFAGLGGFHLALQKLGHKCVFASELIPELRNLYKENHDMDCAGDINEVNIKEIPVHDVLCAGFPCQPFSQAGFQQGFNDTKERGNLFYRIMDILEHHKPEFVLLENVPNLKSHDDGNTYNVIHNSLEKLYETKDDIISPHYFGIPQHRTRIYIVGRLRSKGGLKNFQFPDHTERPECKINSIIDPEDSDYMTLRDITRKHLDVWQEFLDLLVENKAELPTFPIWAMEFGATYKYEVRSPHYQTDKELVNSKGKFGEDICGNSRDDYFNCLPIYADPTKSDKNKIFPDWKKQFIRQNREFYKNNKSWIDTWIHKIKDFENSHQKFEWNCGNEEHPTIYDKIVQFRPSGIRVKKPTFSPALVLTTTQIPIFPWIETPNGKKGRYMTRKEAAKLQCMEGLKAPDTIAKAFRAFGNAVNIEVVKRIAEKLLIDYETDK